jgi:ribosomal-protein-alanine N-acetyltransferase
MKEPTLNLEGSRILLRMLRLSDSWNIYMNIRDKEVGKWSGPDAIPALKNGLSRFGFAYRFLRHLGKGLQLFLNTLRPPKNPKVFRLAIILKDTRKAAGIVTLSRIESKPMCADIGFWIGKKYWGLGLTTEAVQLALEFAFDHLRLERVEAWTFEKNIGSRKVMEKCGFKSDGIIEAAYLKYNEMQNRLNYRILKSEYKLYQGK